MSAKVVILPVVRIDRGDAPDKHPATALTERLTAMLAGADVVNCTDALVRMLAAICSVNSTTDTDAIDLATVIGNDLVELVKAMRAPDVPVDSATVPA
jgi:hypothetical protein